MSDFIEPPSSIDPPQGIDLPGPIVPDGASKVNEGKNLESRIRRMIKKVGFVGAASIAVSNKEQELLNDAVDEGWRGVTSTVRSLRGNPELRSAEKKHDADDSNHHYELIAAGAKSVSAGPQGFGLFFEAAIQDWNFLALGSEHFPTHGGLVLVGNSRAALLPAVICRLEVRITGLYSTGSSVMSSSHGDWSLRRLSDGLSVVAKDIPVSPGVYRRFKVPGFAIDLGDAPDDSKEISIQLRAEFSDDSRLSEESRWLVNQRFE